MKLNKSCRFDGISTNLAKLMAKKKYLNLRQLQNLETEPSRDMEARLIMQGNEFPFCLFQKLENE